MRKQSQINSINENQSHTIICFLLLFPMLAVEGDLRNNPTDPADDDAEHIEVVSI